MSRGGLRSTPEEYQGRFGLLKFYSNFTNVSKVRELFFKKNVGTIVRRQSKANLDPLRVCVNPDLLGNTFSLFTDIKISQSLQN